MLNLLRGKRVKQAWNTRKLTENIYRMMWLNAGTCKISKELLFWFYFEHPFIRSSKYWSFNSCCQSRSMWAESCQLRGWRKEICLKWYLKYIWKDRFLKISTVDRVSLCGKHKPIFLLHVPNFCFHASSCWDGFHTQTKQVHYRQSCF